MLSVTSPLKEIIGTDHPTSLLLGVHHKACALLELFSDQVTHSMQLSRNTLKQPY